MTKFLPNSKSAKIWLSFSIALLVTGVIVLVSFTRSSSDANSNATDTHSTKSKPQTSNNAINAAKSNDSGNVEMDTANSLSKSGTNGQPEKFETYKSSCRQLSLSYPSSWKAITSTDKNLALVSPSNDGFYLSVQLYCGKANEINQNFLGSANGDVIDTLNNGLLLASQKSDETNITGLGLATEFKDGRVSFGLIDNQGKGSNNVTLSANLVPSNSGAALNNSYPLKKYQDFNQYGNLQALFKSITIQ